MLDVTCKSGISSGQIGASHRTVWAEQSGLTNGYRAQSRTGSGPLEIVSIRRIRVRAHWHSKYCFVLALEQRQRPATETGHVIQTEAYPMSSADLSLAVSAVLVDDRKEI